VELLGLGANWRAVGVGWGLAHVRKLSLTLAMIMLGVTSCRGGGYVWWDGREADVAGIYSIVMNRILWSTQLVLLLGILITKSVWEVLVCAFGFLACVAVWCYGVACARVLCGVIGRRLGCVCRTARGYAIEALCFYLGPRNTTFVGSAG
jgi:hypothetical protein